VISDLVTRLGHIELVPLHDTQRCDVFSPKGRLGHGVIQNYNSV
jgi:hypothetical protein